MDVVVGNRRAVRPAALSRSSRGHSEGKPSTPFRHVNVHRENFIPAARVKGGGKWSLV